VEPRTLAYDIQGQGNPLVLIPGGLTGWLSWIPHQARLAQSHRTIRVQPIHNELGSAGKPGEPGYTADTEREALRMTLDALGVDRADFAGWSGGGRALLEFVLEYPERVRSLALVEPAAYWILEQLGESADDVQHTNRFLRRIQFHQVTEDDLAEFLRIAGFVGPDEDARAHPNWARWLSHRNALSWQSEAADRSGRQVDELRRIACPVLLVRGEATAPWLRRVVDVLAALLPHAIVLDLPGDHACHIQNIDEFLDALEPHLAAAR
jgi:pimeloyl-ACP methyl ester carboxylesterase